MDHQVKQETRRSLSARAVKRTAAIVVSAGLHMALLTASLPLMNALLKPPSALPAKIVFEVTPEIPLRKTERKSADIGSMNQTGKTEIRGSGKRVGLRQATSERLVLEKAQPNKEAIMSASLDKLTELRENFRFALERVTADTLGAFAPISGTAPDTDFLMDGVTNGFGVGGRKGLRVRFGGRRGHPRCPAYPPVDTTTVLRDYSGAL